MSFFNCHFTCSAKLRQFCITQGKYFLLKIKKTSVICKQNSISLDLQSDWETRSCKVTEFKIFYGKVQMGCSFSLFENYIFTQTWRSL